MIFEWYENYGGDLVSVLADKLKDVGFHYATIAGISFNMEDLVIPDEKNDHLNTAQKEVSKIAQLQTAALGHHRLC